MDASISAVANSGGGGWKKRFPWSIIGALLLFAALWAMDFPDPMADDLFYSGASLNLAKGGDLSNPLLARQHFPGHLFLIYPPVHPYALALWLKTFGISAASMIGFQSLMYLIIAVATILFLRRQGAPVWMEWLVPLAVMSTFMTSGLRPESLAVALIMSGFTVVECSSRGRILLIAGFFLMALGAASAPRITFFGVAMIFTAGFDCWRAITKKKNCSLVTFITPALTGILGAFLLFVWLLDFHLVDFFAAFRYYSVLVGGSRLMLLHQYLTAGLSTTQWPMFPLLAALLLLAWRGPWSAMKRFGVLLAATLLPVFLVGGLGRVTIWFVFLSTFALAIHLLQNSFGRQRTVLIATSLAVGLLIANLKTLIHIYGIASGDITSNAGRQRGEALAMRATPEQPVLLDADVARYVFDYRIPEGFIYYPFAMPFPKSMAILPQTLLPEDICLLGPGCVETLEKDRLIDLPLPTWNMGLKKWSFFREPRKVYVIRAKELRQTQQPLHD
jgi:hypothetical protein